MRIHRLSERCFGLVGGWQATCACGWAGEVRAREDYRAHIEELLGPDGAYLAVDVACRNCGSAHSQPVLVGTRAMDNACVRCGMRMLHPDNEAWHSSRATRGLFG